MFAADCIYICICVCACARVPVCKYVWLLSWHHPLLAGWLALALAFRNVLSASECVRVCLYACVCLTVIEAK